MINSLSDNHFISKGSTEYRTLHKRIQCIDFSQTLIVWLWILYRYRRSEVQQGRITLYTKTDANGHATTSLTKAFTVPEYASLPDSHDYCVKSFHSVLPSAGVFWKPQLVLYFITCHKRESVTNHDYGMILCIRNYMTLGQIYWSFLM